MANIPFLDPDKLVDEPERTDLVDGDNLIWAGDYAGALKVSKPLTKSKNPYAKAYAFLNLGDLYHFQWSHRSSLSSYGNAVQIFTDLDERRGRIFANYRIADTYLDYEGTSRKKAPERGKSQRAFTASFQEAKRMRDNFLIAFGHHYRGLFLTAQNNFKEAIKELRKAIKIREKINDERHALSSQVLMAVCIGETGDYRLAKQIAEEAYQSQVALGLRGAAVRTLTAISMISDRENSSSLTQMTATLSSVGSNMALGCTNNLSARYQQPWAVSSSCRIMLLLT